MRDSAGRRRSRPAAELRHQAVRRLFAAAQRPFTGDPVEIIAGELDRVLGPRVTRELIHTDIALETTPDGPLYDAMTTALAAEDPHARVIPYCMSAGTDAKSFSRLGMRCFGFVPLRLPPDLDFSGMFHSVDERVPIDALLFGTRVLDRFLDCC